MQLVAPFGLAAPFGLVVVPSLDIGLCHRKVGVNLHHMLVVDNQIVVVAVMLVCLVYKKDIL